MKDEKMFMKERCREWGLIFSIVFWIGAAVEIFVIISGLWIGSQPASAFEISLTDTPSGLFGIVECTGAGSGFPGNILASRLEFDPGVLNEAAQQAPKYIFMAEYFSHAAACIPLPAILWYFRNIFGNIKHCETHFIKDYSRSIFKIGVAVMLFIAIEQNLFPFLAVIKGVSTERFVFVDLGWIVPGSLFFCLSAIFEYGRVLQQESDETL